MNNIYVYVASPFSEGDQVSNVRDSLRVADDLLAYGFIPYTPLLSAFWHFMSPKSYQDWLTLDLHWLARCDVILRLPGASKGADIEVAKAIELGKPVVYSIPELLFLQGANETLENR